MIKQLVTSEANSRFTLVVTLMPTFRNTSRLIIKHLFIVYYVFLYTSEVPIGIATSRILLTSIEKPPFF